MKAIIAWGNNHSLPVVGEKRLVGVFDEDVFPITVDDERHEGRLRQGLFKIFNFHAGEIAQRERSRKEVGYDAEAKFGFH